MMRKRRNKKRRAIIRRRILILKMVLVALVLCGVIIAAFFSLNKNNGNTDQEKTENEQKSIEVSITLSGEKMMTLKLGENFVEPGYSAKDSQGNDLTSKVQVDTSALNRAGEQVVKYVVGDENGNQIVKERTVEVLPNTSYETSGLPICMYHYVYEEENPPADLNSNYISVTALEEQLKYLKENNYYFPNWQEVRDYVDGKLLLPEKSIVLTFDDGPNYMNLGIPLLEKYEIPATSFVIGNYWNSKEMLYGYKSEYLTFESHSYNMHRGGGQTGHGGIYTAMSKEEILDDLEKSFEICGNKNAFAYPFGDYTQEGCEVLGEAGLLCAVTTENGKCKPGDQPMLLPRVRVLGNASLDSFVSSIS